MNYQKNRQLARTTNTEPTLTDQSAAADTDINIIVRNYTVHGQVPGTSQEPMYEDWTQLPDDLRGFLELGRSLEDHHSKLPDSLKNLSLEALLALTPEELTNILKPAEKPAEPEKDKTE